MNEEQRAEAEKTVIGEFSNVKHVRGILSMGRYSDPNSASSSFSILLGDAPHLDGQYAVFGKVTKGDDTLKKLEQVPTRTEGIFVMVCVYLAGGCALTCKLMKMNDFHACIPGSLYWTQCTHTTNWFIIVWDLNFF
ncbi:unnamed protein product [Linum tenue]|nr:unnamed protein product [Linum tenue]